MSHRTLISVAAGCLAALALGACAARGAGTVDWDAAAAGQAPAPTIAPPATEPPTSSTKPPRTVPRATTPHPTKPTLTTPPPRTGPQYGPCLADDLAGDSRETEGAMGRVYLPIALRNIGSGTCTLTGAPTVVLLRDGKVLPTHVHHDHSRPPATVAIPQGGTVTFAIVWINPGMEEDPATCLPASTHVRLTLPRHTGTLTIAAAVSPCHGDIGFTPPALAG